MNNAYNDNNFKMKPMEEMEKSEKKKSGKIWLFWVAVVFFAGVFLFFRNDEKNIPFFSVAQKNNAVSEKNSNGQKDNSKINKNAQAAERSNQEDIFDKKMSVSQFQLVRKDESNDLAVANAHASVMLDADSGTILHYDKGKARRQIASLTKLMTALMVMENVSDLDAPVTIEEDEVYIEGTKIGCPRSGYCISQRLKVGEKISVRSLLKAMMMNSANDAATALGKYVGGGSIEKFVDMMNDRAKKMGLSDTHFCTPSGLEIDGQEQKCYSSAYDVARIAAYDLKFDLLWQIMRLPSGTQITSVDGKIVHDIFNTDEVLDDMPECLGTKTGFTPLAGYSLMMAAVDSTKKHKIVAVILDDPQRWQDIRQMVNWAFSAYEWK